MFYSLLWALSSMDKRIDEDGSVNISKNTYSISSLFGMSTERLYSQWWLCVSNCRATTVRRGLLDGELHHLTGSHIGVRHYTSTDQHVQTNFNACYLSSSLTVDPMAPAGDSSQTKLTDCALPVRAIIGLSILHHSLPSPPLHKPPLKIYSRASGSRPRVIGLLLQMGAYK